MLPFLNIDDVEGLLDQAIWLIEAKKDSCPDHIREALISRFIFRKRFLRAVALDPCVLKEEYAASWRNCSSALPLLLDSSKYGSTVPQSFSAKIQRRFASTVPPRPVIMNDLKDTYDYLQRFFDDAEAAGGVFDCLKGSQIFVRSRIEYKPGSVLIVCRRLYQSLRRESYNLLCMYDACCHH